MKSGPVPRPGVYELYWRFAARRQAAFERRIAGEPRPWTEDGILQRFKFCNVFRAADRVSQYLIRQVAYGQTDGSERDRLFRIVAFRTFSREATWDGLTQWLGRPPSLEDLSSGRFEHALEDLRASQGKLYTGAFILCATKAYGFDLKHRNHVALFKDMFLKSRLAERLLVARSLKEIVDLLGSFPLMGPFMSYQTAIDLNYSDLINFDEDDYTQAGPGALRGIAKVFKDTKGHSPADVIQWMVAQQEAEFKRLGLDFKGLRGRRLHAIDCQGLFCETDKYCREAVPELASNRTRIKARFTPSTAPLQYFFPPKWGINGRQSTEVEHPAAVFR